jgi:hypothetical protein
MPINTTANQIGGRAIGSIFFTLFGTLWIGLSLYASGRLNLVSGAWLFASLAAMLTVSLWLLRLARHFPRVPEDPAIGRRFNRINAIQWTAIAVVAFAFARLHLDTYVLSAITAIVGLHLYPLARLFRYPLHYVTAIALVLWAGLGCLIFPASHLQSATAAGTGIILLLSSATTQLVVMASLRRPARFASTT